MSMKHADGGVEVPGDGKTWHKISVVGEGGDKGKLQMRISDCAYLDG